MPKRLIRALTKIPGIGQRTAIRIALHMLEHRETVLQSIMVAIEDAYQTIHSCSICGLFTTHSVCEICTDDTRNKKILCITEHISDVWALEETKNFFGLYHILGGVLSVGKYTPDSLNINTLYQRVKGGDFEEIILALSSTVEGQTTSYYIMDLLKPICPHITVLAHGIPLGGELNYLDSGTLSIALQARHKLD